MNPLNPIRSRVDNVIVLTSITVIMITTITSITIILMNRIQK